MRGNARAVLGRRSKVVIIKNTSYYSNVQLCSARKIIATTSSSSVNVASPGSLGAHWALHPFSSLVHLIHWSAPDPDGESNSSALRSSLIVLAINAFRSLFCFCRLFALSTLAEQFSSCFMIGCCFSAVSSVGSSLVLRRFCGVSGWREKWGSD